MPQPGCPFRLSSDLPSDEQGCELERFNKQERDKQHQERQIRAYRLDSPPRFRQERHGVAIM
jgi:hypothetical protein